MMIGFVMCGAGGAVGHHFYYRSLDDTLVNSIDQQTWAIRIGTGLAFLTRTFLVAAVGVAAAQEMWATLRKKTIRIHGIDSMFAVLNNPISFFTWDLWVNAKTLTLLAIISWSVYPSPSRNHSH
jgi:H+/Cl- antiporter ClcA